MILQRYETLCKERGEFPSVAVAVAGYDRSALTNWRKQASENGGMSPKNPSKYWGFSILKGTLVSFGYHSLKFL